MTARPFSDRFAFVMAWLASPSFWPVVGCLAFLPLAVLPLQGQPQRSKPVQAEAPTPVAGKPAVANRPAAVAGRAATGAWKNLKFGKLGDVKIPEIESFTLPNGLKVYLLENKSLPLVNGLALVRTGTLLEPADKTGLFGIAGEVLRTGGTTEKSGDLLDEELEAIAASVESGISDNLATVSFNCLKENTDQVMGIFHSVLTSPGFRQDKLDLLKTQYRSAIARRYDDADSIHGSEFSSLVYGRNTPFGREVEYETIDRITRADLVAFHQRFFFPANTVLAISGDIDKAAIKEKVQAMFGSWNASQPPAPAFPTVSNVAKPGIYLGEKKDVTQSFFTIGHLGGVLSDKDYPALEVLSDLLGGGFDSRLFRKVRTELGYAYQIGSSWGAGYLHPGLFTISGSTKSETTVPTIKAILGEVARIRSGLVEEKELADAKAKVANSFVFNFTRPASTLSRLLRYEYYGYPKDFLFAYQKGIQAVTREDVLRVAKQYLQPEKFVMVVVGNPAEFKTPLSDLNLPIEKLDLTVKEPKQAAAKADAASVAKGIALLKRAQEAVGGAEKLASIKDFTRVANAKLGAMNGSQTTMYLAPDKFRQEQVFPIGNVVAMWDGEKGTLVTPQGTMPMPPPVVRQVKESLFSQLIPGLLLSDRVTGRSVVATGEHTLEISDPTAGTLQLDLDPASGLPAKIRNQVTGPQGKMEVTTEFADWRAIDGLKVPHQQTTKQGNAISSTMELQRFSVNTGLKVEDITKK